MRSSRLFNVSDINATLLEIERLLRGGTAVKRKRMTEEDRARREQALANSKRLRELAEKAQAEIDRRKQHGAST